MRAAAVALLLALAVVVSDSALARKGGGHVSGGGVKFSGGHVSGGKVHGGRVSHGHGHFNGHHHHGHHHKSFGHHHKSFGHHHHGHHHNSTTFVGFGFAYPWSWYGYYPPPYYYPGYYPQPVAYPAQPVTYVEQGAAPAPAEPAGWWYYCEASRTYYPYVKECPSGWQRVPALPPPPN
jgi:hypothetical protein